MNRTLRWLVARCLWALLALLGTATLTFLLTHVIPGDVARVVAGPKANEEALKMVHQRLHLDQPLWKRFGDHLSKLLHGDLGHSFITNQSVSSAILTRLPTTMALGVMTTCLWMLIAVPAGVFTATRHGSLLDLLALVVATLTLAIPGFWLAQVLQYSLAYKLGWFPVAGYASIQHLILPALVLALTACGYYARLIHACLVEILSTPYVRTARAKGASEAQVLFVHGFRNALIPVVTILGMDVAFLLGGVLFVENIFAIPGLGTLAVEAVNNLDVPMIMGTVQLSAGLIVGSSLLVDLLNQWLDPRVEELSPR
jgi:peptide/nickel transport system permease protein